MSDIVAFWRYIHYNNFGATKYPVMQWYSTPLPPHFFFVCFFPLGQVKFGYTQLIFFSCKISRFFKQLWKTWKISQFRKIFHRFMKKFSTTFFMKNFTKKCEKFFISKKCPFFGLRQKMNYSSFYKIFTFLWNNFSSSFFLKIMIIRYMCSYYG